MKHMKPVYLLAGGPSSQRKSPDPLIQTILKETGKLSPDIAYLGAASGDDKRFFAFIADFFLRAGAGKVTQVFTASAKSDIGKARDLLSESDVVFISGGDVEAGMKVLRERNIMDFLRQLFDSGKLFFGLSAGSIMLAREWVRWRDPDDDSTAELFPCLGFAPVICDTHAEADDWVELKTALSLEKENTLGYGLATGTGIRITPEGQVEAMGGPVWRYIRTGGGIERLPDLEPGF